MHRITNFLLHARLAFCDGDRNRGQDPHHRGGRALEDGHCSVWAEAGCGTGILAAAAGCFLINAPDGEVGLIPCVSAVVMGIGSVCYKCICQILNLPQCLSILNKFSP